MDRWIPCRLTLETREEYFALKSSLIETKEHIEKEDKAHLSLTGAYYKAVCDILEALEEHLK